jgi:hypothetical protein
MQKFIISLKEKQTGRDVMPPYIVNSLDGLGTYSERVSPLGLIIIVDSIKEEEDTPKANILLEPELNIEEGRTATEPY